MVDANIPSELAALPIDTLIGAPLEAAMRAQAQSALTTAEFITSVGLDNDNNVKNINFKYGKRTIDPNTGNTVDTLSTLNVPLLTITPIPYVRIRDMTIHFNFKIVTSAIDTSASSFKGGLEVQAGWGWGKAKLSASYSSDKTQKSSVDRTGELDIVVNAVQDEMPEGLRTVLSLLKESIKDNPSTVNSGSVNPIVTPARQ